MDNITILNPDNSNAWIIYTKSNCSFCYKVKELLENEPIITIVNCDELLKNIGKKDKFLTLIKDIVGCEWRTFPMVFLNNKFIGGYTETKKIFDDKLNCELIVNDDF